MISHKPFISLGFSFIMILVMMMMNKKEEEEEERRRGKKSRIPFTVAPKPI